MKISVILFDFVGVLLVPDPRAAATPLVDAIDARIGKVIDDAQFQREVLQDFSLDPERLQPVLDQVVQKYQPYAPLWSLLPVFKQRFRLGVINNGTWLTYPLFDRRFHLADTFDAFISSAFEGVRKPDRRIYLRACEKLGAAPENCLFMDDSEENVMGARRVGMQAIHWKTPEMGFDRLVKELT